MPRIAWRLQLAGRGVYRTVFGMLPIFALLVVNEVFARLVGDTSLLVALQVYSGFVIVASIAHLTPLIILSLRRRLHNAVLLVLAVCAHAIVIWLAGVHGSQDVFWLFLAPAVLLLCYHVIENDVHATLLTE